MTFDILDMSLIGIACFFIGRFVGGWLEQQEFKEWRNRD